VETLVAGYAQLSIFLCCSFFSSALLISKTYHTFSGLGKDCISGSGHFLSMRPSVHAITLPLAGPLRPSLLVVSSKKKKEKRKKKKIESGLSLA